MTARRIVTLAAAAATVALATWSSARAAGATVVPSQVVADRVFVNGPVITIDTHGHTARALAVKDGRILEVGDEASVRKLVGRDTVVTDLGGRALVPGFIDAHSHFLGVGTALYGADLNSPPIGAVRSIDDIVRILAERAKSVPEGGTIVGRGYDDTLLAERRHPTRHDLDRASTRHRIIIRHISGHFSAANSRAIEESGIGPETRDPTNGVIRREADGTPLGVFEETAASLVKRGPDAVYGRAQQLEAAKQAAAIYAAQGVTTAQHSSAGKRTFELLKAAQASGSVKLRLVLLPNGTLANASSPPVDPATAIADGLVLGPVKLFADGSIQGYTGYLSDPYHVAPPQAEAGYRGYPAQSCNRVETRVAALVARGWQVAIHGNGDAAIDCALGAMEKARPLATAAHYRPVVIHAQMSRPDQLDRMKAIGATPSFFSLHTYYWGDRHRDQFIGPERAARISPVGSSLARALRYTVHTDSPVVPMDQIRLLWATVNRVTTGGAVLGPEERVSALEALRAMTYNAAYQYGLERELGSLERGKLADLVILSEDPLAVAPRALDGLRVVETIVGGKTIFAAGNPDRKEP
ncbi:amidohydrolase family protein [Sphingomonas sp. LY54]|uniref:amidohydrolase n=1 Tax=Sphingomonas sp. LY54 TaxID=3095343 RepID=UPI002D766BAF|nr:amidohydrolase family protein [Sphingomonas sp. LY54]WRP29973.1 amidohydrolase family protein [Sphingomonas sp. LY54]